jgi:hypothetical protein
MSGSYEGEQFASTHLTEKGALLACIGEILEFLGVEDEETARSVMDRRGGLDAELADEVIEWDFNKLKEMDRNKLHGVLGEWYELTWDNDLGWSLDIHKTVIAA